MSNPRTMIYIGLILAILVGVIALGYTNTNIQDKDVEKEALTCPDSYLSAQRASYFDFADILGITVAHATSISAGTDKMFCFSEEPLPNRPVEVLFIFKNKISTSLPVRATIDLPQDFVLLEGEVTWQGELGPYEERHIEASVKSTEPGFYKLWGSIFIGKGSWEGHPVYLELKEDEVIFHKNPTDTSKFLGKKMSS